MAALIRPRVGLLICNYTTYIFLYLQIFLLGFLILVVIASTASREKYSHWVQQWTYKSVGPFSPCQDLSTHCRRHHRGSMPPKHSSPSPWMWNRRIVCSTKYLRHCCPLCWPSWPLLHTYHGSSSTALHASAEASSPLPTAATTRTFYYILQCQPQAFSE